MTTAQERAAERVYRTIDRPTALPLDTGGLDANGNDIVRESDGWYVLDAQDRTTGPLSATELAYPLRIRRHKGGETRHERRKAARFKAKRVAAFHRASADKLASAQ